MSKATQCNRCKKMEPGNPKNMIHIKMHHLDATRPPSTTYHYHNTLEKYEDLCNTCAAPILEYVRTFEDKPQ